MRYGIVLAALVALPAFAAERAENALSLDIPLPAGAVVRVENLLGSTLIQGSQTKGTIKIEAKVVAEGEEVADAEALAKLVTLSPTTESGKILIRPAYPVDRHPALKLPRSDAQGPFAKWIGPLVKRDKVAYPWDGRTVWVGNSREATPLAVHLVVTVPFDAKVSAQQIVGPVQVARFRGDLDVENVDGGIDATQMYGSLKAHTGAGLIDLRTFKGERLDLETVSGNIALQDVRADAGKVKTSSGEIRGETVGGAELAFQSGAGSVDLDRADSRRLDVETVSGAVKVASTLATTKHASIRSKSGDVSLAVGTGAHFDASLKSGAGDFEVKGLPRVELVAKEGNGATYRQGAGGIELALESESGSATLLRSKN